MKKTCLHRFLGECKECIADYEPISPTHPINNNCCKSYYEIHAGAFEVIECEEQKRMLFKPIKEEIIV
jgi:hypothetical protein